MHPLREDLRHDMSNVNALQIIQHPADCIQRTTYWAQDVLACLRCPSFTNVSFLPKTAELAGRSGSRVPSLGQVELINTEAYPIALTPMKTIVPPWISYNMSFNETKTADIPGTYTMIGPGESMTIGIVVNPSSLEEGTALSSVTFGVFVGGNQTGCAGADIGFDVYMRVERPPTLNHLGNIAYIGLVLFCIIALTAIGLEDGCLRTGMLVLYLSCSPSF
jgi:hypothetical protein